MQNLKENIKKMTSRPGFWPRLSLILFVLILILVSFQFGRSVGLRQAGFAGRLGDNYRALADRGRQLPEFPPFEKGLPGGHGAVGKIIKVSLPTIVISTPDNLEKTILLDEGTLIRNFRENASSSELVVGKVIVALGEPNESAQIVAKLIRLLPEDNKQLRRN